MRLQRVLLVASVLGVGIAVHGVAGAQGNASPNADLSVTTQAFELPDPSQSFASVSVPLPMPFLIGDKGILDSTITNNGPDDAVITVNADYPDQTDSWTRTLQSGGLVALHNCDAPPLTDHHTSCTAPLAAGQSWDVYSGIQGHAPGPAAVTISVTSSIPDPDPSNNTSTWQTTVQCSIMGTDGDDTLIAGPGQSACGLGGNDTLIGVGHGVLGLYGGSGDDTLVVGQVDSLGVLADGGPGTDTADFSAAQDPLMLCPINDDAVEGQPITDGLGFATLTSVETVVGSPAADRLIAGNGVTTIFGGGGNDWISAGSGADALHGGPGNDRFNSSNTKRDLIEGGNGKDRVNADRHDRVVSAKNQAAPTFSDPCNW